MARNRLYERELSAHKHERLVRLYENHLNSKGFLSKLARQRLLKLKKRERETPDSDFWYSIKRSARGTLMDLELICSVANDDQLEDIFTPFTDMDHLKLDLLFGARKKEDLPKEWADVRGEYSRTDLTRLLRVILSADDKAVVQWKAKLCIELIETGIDYMAKKPELQSNLHQRLFGDLMDAIRGSYHSAG